VTSKTDCDCKLFTDAAGRLGPGDTQKIRWKPPLSRGQVRNLRIRSAGRIVIHLHFQGFLILTKKTEKKNR